MLAHFSVMQGEHRPSLNEKNKIRNQKIVNNIAAYSDAELLQSVPSELMMSLVIGATKVIVVLGYLKKCSPIQNSIAKTWLRLLGIHYKI
jgi:hypothetical protein